VYLQNDFSTRLYHIYSDISIYLAVIFYDISNKSIQIIMTYQKTAYPQTNVNKLLIHFYNLPFAERQIIKMKVED